MCVTLSVGCLSTRALALSRPAAALTRSTSKCAGTHRAIRTTTRAAESSEDSDSSDMRLFGKGKSKSSTETAVFALG